MGCSRGTSHTQLIRQVDLICCLVNIGLLHAPWQFDRSVSPRAVRGKSSLARPTTPFSTAASTCDYYIRVPIHRLAGDAMMVALTADFLRSSACRVQSLQGLALYANQCRRAAGRQNNTVCISNMQFLDERACVH